MTTPVAALIIAGSDSSGGAGMHADLRTFSVHGIHGATAITAVTAQNTVGVQGVHAVPADFVAQQIDSVLDDLDVRAVKTGMLGAADVVSRVAEIAAAGRLPNLVVDPVMVSSTGARLLEEGAEVAYRELLLPRARVVTPNRSEAAVLCQRDLDGIDDVVSAAIELAALGPEVVVVTGGDVGGSSGAVDIVVAGGEVHRRPLPRVDTVNDHGTGCSFASAIAARLALGDAPLEAIAHAQDFVHRALAGAAGWRLGAGHGPIDHHGWSAARPSLST